MSTNEYQLPDFILEIQDLAKFYESEERDTGRTENPNWNHSLGWWYQSGYKIGNVSEKSDEFIWTPTAWIYENINQLKQLTSIEKVQDWNFDGIDLLIDELMYILPNNSKMSTQRFIHILGALTLLKKLTTPDPFLKDKETGEHIGWEFDGICEIIETFKI